MRGRRTVLLGATLLTAPWGSCTEETIRVVPGPSVIAIYGDPLETALVPFPSDRHTRPDPTTATRLRVSIGPETSADAIVAGYPIFTQRFSEMDGFSTSGGVAAGLTGPIDGALFSGPQGGVAFEALDPSAFTKKGSPIILLDVDPASPEVGRPVGLFPRYFAQEKNDEFLEDEYSIVARPEVPLAPGRRYLFALTDALVSLDGESVGRSDATKALLEDDPADDYAVKVDEGLDVLERSIGITRDEIVVVSVFTTASVTSELFALAGAIKQTSPPALAEPWEVESTSTEDARIRFRARFTAPEYRSSEGTFVVEGGLPQPQGSEDLELFLAFSDRDVSGPRPIVIYQHGLGGDKDGSWGAAERLSELGVAVVSIDSPEHGSRGGGATSVLESVFAFFGIDAVSYAFDVAKARDNFRQLTADQLELVRFLRSQSSLDLLPVGAPDGVPDLDTSQVLYIGHSFGSVQGPSLFALAPEVTHAVWNVGGDGLMFIMEDSVLFSVMVDFIKPFGTTDGQLARFFSAGQAVVDPGDPLNYARHCLIAPPEGSGLRSILLQEVMDDGIVPNTSTEALARAAGLAQLAPVRAVPGLQTVTGPARGNGPGGSTAVLTQFATMNGGEKATHGELYFAPEGRDQYVEFFRTALETGLATVRAPDP